MKEIKQLAVVLGAAIFFIGLFFISDKYAEDLIKEFSGQISNASAANSDSVWLYAEPTLEAVNLEAAILKDEKANEVKKATITAVGDIMFHSWQIERAYDWSTDTFDFSDSFEYVKDTLSDGDFTVGNLETTLAGRNKGNSQELYGYCTANLCFNSPEIAAKNLADAGFDLLGLANNHSLDSWKEGIWSTIDYCDEAGLKHVGTAKESKDLKYDISTVNGIRVGFLAYTNETNGFSLADEYKYALNTLGNYDEEQIQSMCEDVKTVKAAGAETVFVMVHFGAEYATTPDEDQKAVVDKLFEAGADVILGSHPHVLQPLEVRTIADPDGAERTGVVIYSLGNFLSSQYYTAEQPNDTDIGLIMDVTLEKTGTGKPKITGISLEPTYVNWTTSSISVLPLCKVHDNMEQYEDILSDTSKERINTAYDNVITKLLEGSGLSHTYQDFKYFIDLSK